MERPKKTMTEPRIPVALPPELEERLKSRFNGLHTELSTTIREYAETARLEYMRDISSILDNQTQLIKTLISLIEVAEQMEFKVQEIVPISSSVPLNEQEQIIEEQNQEIEPLPVHDMKPNHEQETSLVSGEEAHALGLRFVAYVNAYESIYKEVYEDIFKDAYRGDMASIMNAIASEFSDYVEKRISATEYITWSKETFDKPVIREKYDLLYDCLNHFEPILKYKKVDD